MTIMTRKVYIYLLMVFITACIPEKEMPLKKLFQANDSITLRALKSVEMYKYQTKDQTTFSTAPPAYRGARAKEHWEQKEKGKLFWSEISEVSYQFMIDSIKNLEIPNHRFIRNKIRPPVRSYKELIEFLNKEDCKGCKIVDIRKPEAEIYPEYSKEAIEQEFKKNRGLRGGVINPRGQLFSFSIYNREVEDSIGNKVISDYSSYSIKYYYTGQTPDPPPPVFDEEGNIIPDEE